jgi:DNA repair ATPase RecN
MTNITEIDDALSAALHALQSAQAALRKSAPSRSLDVLRKADLDPPRANGDDLAKALARLEDHNRRHDAAAATVLAQMDDLQRRVDDLKVAAS